MMSTYYELTVADVGRATIRAFGRVWPTSGFIGRVLPGDVGKRVYQCGDILQVENNEQRDKRLTSKTDSATPRPWTHEAYFSQDFRWIKDATGHTVASTSNEPNSQQTAALIVRAVNCHDKLTALLRRVRQSGVAPELHGEIDEALSDL